MEAWHKLVRKLEYILRDVDRTHGIGHALMVHAHCSNAYGKDDGHKLQCEVAALLHDADDRKYHPASYVDGKCTYANAKMCMNEAGYSEEFQEEVILMISMVSCSANGNSDTYPADHKLAGKKVPEWVLYPRYADRLEACGKVGFGRCLDYNTKIGCPIIHPDTPRFTTISEIYEECERRAGDYQRNKGASRSVIDHYYDKIIPLSRTLSNLTNLYFRERFIENHLYDISVVLGGAFQ